MYFNLIQVRKVGWRFECFNNDNKRIIASMTYPNKWAAKKRIKEIQMSWCAEIREFKFETYKPTKKQE